MSRRDIFHQTVVNALIQEGWIITDDPLHLAYGGRNLYADLGAEQPIGAEKEGRKIAVEIKSFIAESDIYDLELAIGQYRLYRSILAKTQPDRSLYLAIPAYSYEGIFKEPIGQLAIEQEQLQLIVFDDEKGTITQWIP